MNKANLVSIDWVVDKLGLSELPKKFSYEIIANYVINGDFEMYFDEPVVGTDATEDVGMVCDGEGRLVGWSIENGYSIKHSGRKIAAGVDVIHSDGAFKFAVNDYYFHEERFYPTDSEGEWLRPKFVDVDLVSFDKNQINSFIPSKNFSKAKGEQGLLKALALLAREAADKSSKFRHGNKVNAKAFKDHVVDLAKEYFADDEDKVPDGNIKKLDDRINKALIELDLKDTT